jgi:hypothetical protein
MEQQQFYITTGHGGGMYTLRETYYDHWGVFKPTHIKSLSRDYDQAVAKAREYVCEAGYDPERDLDVGHVTTLQHWGDCNPENSRQLERLQRGQMPFGKYMGEPLVEVPINYLHWVLDNTLERSGSNYTPKNVLRDAIKNDRGLHDFWLNEAQRIEQAQEAQRKLIEERAGRSKHVGTEGERLKGVELTCKFTKRFIDTYDGCATNERWLHKFEDAAGNEYVYWGSRELLRPEQSATFNFTIKYHRTYDYVAQTHIGRPSIVKGAN